jgi:hypothetical protein
MLLTSSSQVTTRRERQWSNLTLWRCSGFRRESDVKQVQCLRILGDVCCDFAWAGTESTRPALDAHGSELDTYPGRASRVVSDRSELADRRWLKELQPTEERLDPDADGSVVGTTCRAAVSAT